MSSPSTPRTNTRHASPTTDEPASPQIITPGKKIRALLSAFDDDSDSGNERTQRVSRSERSDTTNHTTHQPAANSGNDANAEDEDDEDEDIVMPRGRMAARMQEQSQNSSGDANEGETAFERVSRMIREENKAIESELGDKSRSSYDDDDDIPTAGRRGRPEDANEQLESQSPTRARSFSPLFMSSPPAAAQEHDSQNSQSEGEPQLKGNARFRALVAQKRKEREEKEKVEAEKKRAARTKQMEQFSSEILSGDEGSGEDDPSSGRKLAKQSRPARKASKKAIEEMHRETQRMSRNMQLTHQMQTKKKITKESLFARFNFMQPDGQVQPAGSSSTANSERSSDAEPHKGADTPQTSPVLGPREKDAFHATAAQAQTLPEAKTTEDEVEDLPSVDQLLIESKEQAEAPAPARSEHKPGEHSPTAKPNERRTLTAAPVRVRLSRESVAQTQKENSDDDLEVVTSPGKCRRIAIFENLPAKRTQEPAALTKLKALAHLTSPDRRNASMNTAELSAILLQRAKQQAAQERLERIQELKAKGIIIETAEERAALEDNIEDLMERARKEGIEIAKREKMASKQQGEADEEDDDDFELSGSDEEGYGDDEDEDEGEGERQDGDGENANYIENEANEDDESEDALSEAMSESEAEKTPARRKRPTRVISDDEDDDQEPRTPARQIAQMFGSVERPQFPGLPGSNGLTMSLTQAFAGTLGDNQETQGNGSMIPNTLPDPVQTGGLHEDNSQGIIKDSQGQRAESIDLLAGYTPSDARVSESPAPRAMSQFSQIPEPTQDAGFVLSPFDPSKRFMGTPTSTIETVLIGRIETQSESHQTRRPLKRGQAPRPSAIDEDQEGDFEINASAFDVMKKATKKPSIAFDRKKSKAKEVVEEAAEESDDEYAGLGGASDDSEGEEDGYDRQMINDNSGEKVDEKELAALNAAHDRAADEKQVAKLLKDINSGALRRQRGADDDFDLDDSDDEFMARRRQKQREFARMRKALLADERVGQIAENPKKAAFFKAIEDRDSDDEIGLDFLDGPSQDTHDSSSQDVQSEAQQKGGLPDSETNNRKRPLEPSAEDSSNRPPPHLRRKPASAMSKKPASLAEIRETLSFLTETQEYDSFREAASMDEHEEETDDRVEDSQPTTNDGFVIPTHHPRRTRGPVVDRLALLRQASSNSANSASTGSRFAFHTGSDSGNDVGFRPSFARRASSSSSSSGSTLSTMSDSSRRVSKPSSTSSTVKKGSVNSYTAARERERERELRAKQRAGGSNITKLLNKHASNTLSALGEARWE